MRFLLIFLCWLLWSLPSEAQKVALVLSGGGAKGLAHVGVLKMLEENNIPIDYIVGTSMGGVIGGFYAAGYSAQEIEQLVLRPEFQEWVNGELGSNYNFYYSKQEDHGGILNLNLAVDSSLNLNTNLANDFAINYALSELLAPAAQHAGYNFDSLFIPFRAVAADIFTQKVVVLKDGLLSEALRATLSVPFFFRPMKITDKYLFDGGIYNNFPVDVAREEFKPDIVIGVNVSSKVFEEYPFDKADELIKQSLLSMLLAKPNVKLLTEEDIYLEPNLKSYSSLDFKDVVALVDSGYVEANAHLQEIQTKIPVLRDCDTTANARHKFILASTPLRFKNLRIFGFSEPQQRYISRLFSDKEYLSSYDIRTGYYKMISEEYFRNIHPRIGFDSLEKVYDFEIFGSPQKNFNIDFGGNISTRSISQIFLGINFSHFNHYLFKHSMNFYTGRFYQSFQFSSRINIPTSKLFYIEPVFTFNHWDFIDANELLLAERDPTIIDQIDRTARFNLGFAVGTRGRLRLHSGYFYNTNRYSNEKMFVSTDTLDRMNFSGFKHGMEFSRHNLNRKQYASSGQHFRLALDYIASRERLAPGNTSAFSSIERTSNHWLRLKFRAEQYFGSGAFRYGYLLESVFSNQSASFDLTGSRIIAPSFNPLVDSRTLFLEHFRAFNYLGGGIRNVIALSRNLDLRLEGYFFKPFRELAEAEDQDVVLLDDLTKFYFAATAATVYHSPLGPISFQLNYYDDDEHQLGALLHVGYLIFNKQPLD